MLKVYSRCEKGNVITFRFGTGFSNVLFRLTRFSQCETETAEEQECIPVGCVPSAAVAASGLGCLPWGYRGVYNPPRTE